ncbi:MAG TPA: phosphatidate cytidylyltransferase [Clostridiales bacterium]|nr:phosphatidate cytidylyltransferase [Clostridiales bacterium]
MFKDRLIGSIFVLLFTITFVVIGGEVLFFGLLVISLIGMMELYRTLKLNKTSFGILGYVAAIAYYLFIYFNVNNHLFLLIIFLLLTMFAYVITFPKYNIEQVSFVFIGLFYVAVMLSFIYRVRILDGGAYLVWLIFIGAWGSDTSAYCVGSLIGKRKFLPRLSPKKSLEGCIGGIVGAALIGFVFGLIFENEFAYFSNPKLLFAIISACASVISQLGDLAASAIKRNNNIKDYGKLIPGHGGVLDRFDSIIFVAPVVYYFIIYIR